MSWKVFFSYLSVLNWVNRNTILECVPTCFRVCLSTFFVHCSVNLIFPSNILSQSHYQLQHQWVLSYIILSELTFSLTSLLIFVCWYFFLFRNGKHLCFKQTHVDCFPSLPDCVCFCSRLNLRHLILLQSLLLPNSLIFWSKFQHSQHAQVVCKCCQIDGFMDGGVHGIQRLGLIRDSPSLLVKCVPSCQYVIVLFVSM